MRTFLHNGRYLLMEFTAASDCSLLVRAPSDISLRANRQVLRLFRSMQTAALPGVTSYSPAYSSLLIRFDPKLTCHARIESAARDFLSRCDEQLAEHERTCHVLPVHYAGYDLDEVATRCRMTVADVIAIHTSQPWTVYFLGFLPGFAYMGELPETLHVPRRAAPRTAVPAGSVAIAGRNTGVYPFSAPGGWNLIGHCPVPLFNADWKQPSLLAPGDHVQFHAVSVKEYRKLSGIVE